MTSGYKEFMITRMSKFANAMKTPGDAMWLWEELSLTDYTRGLWENMSEEEKKSYKQDDEEQDDEEQDDEEQDDEKFDEEQDDEKFDEEQDDEEQDDEEQDDEKFDIYKKDREVLKVLEEDIAKYWWSISHVTRYLVMKDLDYLL